MSNHETKWWILKDEKKYAPKEYFEIYKEEVTESRIRLESFLEHLEKISEKAKLIEMPDERKRELIEIYKAWGSYGWTIIPSAPDKLFDSLPLNTIDADNIALPHCNEERIEKIINLINEKNFDKTYFEEAVFCYANKKYIATTSLMFPIIESIIITFGKEQNTTNKNLKVGKKAIMYYDKKINEKYDDVDRTMFAFLWYYSLKSCLEKIFENANAFKTQPNVINRNFLLHGMISRTVQQKDCIQLFLVLYNLLNMFSKFDSKCED